MPNSPHAATRVLLLGGTTEASALAGRLAARPEFQATMSLAGRTRNPKASPIPTCIGGFGGVDGLRAYIEHEGIDVVVDATHPFAARMSHNAVAACAQTGCPLIAVERPPWRLQSGDNWQSVPGVEAGIAMLGPNPRRVLMAIGRQQLGLLEAQPQHTYVIRVIDPPAVPPKLPHSTLIAARGPFTVADDIALMKRERIEVFVAKNSGGDAAVAKLHAARTLSIPVVMVDRPSVPQRTTIATADAALDWLIRHHDRTKRGE